MKKKTLLICIGNEIRSDDGVAIHLAKELGKYELQETEIYTSHQLLPELSEKISNYDQVIFIDASIDEKNKVELIKIENKNDYTDLSTFHFLSPEVILGFAGKLFNKKQEAYLLKIPVIDFKFGTELHPETKSKMLEAINILIDFLTCNKNGKQNETNQS